MSSGRRRGEAAGKSRSPASSLQPPRILVVDIHAPSWAHTGRQLCEALENVFSLACSLAGPPRVPLLSLYVTWTQKECLLPFTPVRGNFARLQGCLAELRTLPVEGAFRPMENLVAQAVQDGLQQFKQYTRQGMAGATLSSSSVEITVLTGQSGTELVRQLEAKLQGTDLVSLRQLQVIEISRGGFQRPSDAESAGPSRDGASRGTGAVGPLAGVRLARLAVESLEEAPAQLPSCSSPQPRCPVQRATCHLLTWRPLQTQPSFLGDHLIPWLGLEHAIVLGADVELQVVENNIVALEMFFKGWLHDHSADQEHLHLLLPTGAAGPRASLACLKCDVQERLLSPALLPAASGEDTRRPFWMEAGGGPAVPQLRVVRALKAGGLCQSVLYGLPLIVRPTNCWQLSWEELEGNQQRFQALCHSLGRREWLLLARFEPQGSGPSEGFSASPFQVLLPSDSSTLLLCSVAVQELFLPCNLPPLPAEPPQAALNTVEKLLDSLEVEPAYNPLNVTCNLYRNLRSSLGRTPSARPPNPPRQQSSRQSSSKSRATVAPLHLAPPVVTPLFSSEEEEFPDAE